MISINIQEVFNLIESSFELLLVVNSDEKIMSTITQVAIANASRLLQKESKVNNGALIGKPLNEVVTENSYEQFKNVMEETKLGQRDSVLFTTNNGRSIALKARYADSNGGLYIFFGSMIDELGNISAVDKTEMTK